MREACYCGRVGEIEDRQPVTDGNSERALRCPDEACGHVDYLYWLSEDVRDRAFEEAKRGASERRVSAA